MKNIFPLPNLISIVLLLQTALSLTAGGPRPHRQSGLFFQMLTLRAVLKLSHATYGTIRSPASGSISQNFAVVANTAASRTIIPNRPAVRGLAPKKMGVQAQLSPICTA